MRRSCLLLALVAVLLTSFSVCSSEPLSLVHPLYNGARIIQYFDNREESKHNSVIWGVPTGTSVKAAASGVVLQAGWVEGYGMQIILDHGDGVETHYARLSKFLVAKGALVTQGQIIAYSGNTGASSEPSLCFELWRNDTAEDPLDYISNSSPQATTPTASHFKKEPLGMDGWAWGLNLSSVAGYLVLEDDFTGVPGIRVYSRTDRKDCSFLGGGWQTVFQFFKNDKFVGVACASKQQYISFVVDYLIVETLGEPAIDEANGTSHLMLWSGEQAAVLYLGSNDENPMVMIFIGLKSFIAEVCLSLMGTTTPQ